MPPILKYPGAKWRMAPWILEHLPSHESYLEPFAGSLAVFLQKPKSRIETLNDLDHDVVNFFQVCRDCPEALARAINLTPWAREEFAQSIAAGEKPCTQEGKVEQARRFAIRCWMAYGASASSTSWRSSTGTQANGGPDNPKLWSRVPKTIVAAATRLKEAHIECRPAVEVIRRYNGPRVLIYADPPYLPETRTAHRDQYRHEMTVEDHVELLETLRAHSGMVLLSGYDSTLYREMLPDWRMVTKRTQAEGGATRIEVLWLNPAAAGEVDGPTLWAAGQLGHQPTLSPAT